VFRAIFKPLRSVVRVGGDFVRDRRATMHILLAAGIIPLVGAVGLAVDSSRAFVVKSRLSHAVDVAALAGARVYTHPDRDDDIEDFFKANFPDGYMDAIVEPLTIIPSDANRTLTVKARATIPATFMRVLGSTSITVSASAEATLESRSVEVALVLDVTGSMLTDNRIGDLKDAANELVDIVVQDTQTPFYSKVALVPYSAAVNVGSYASQVRGSYTNTTCQYPAAPTCRYYRFPTYADPTDWNTHEISTCVTERTGPEAYTDAPPTVALVGKNYPHSSNPCLSAQILPLTSNRSTLHSRINALSAVGSTAGQIGIAWGWYMVSPNFAYLWPAASQPAPYGTDDLLKVVVIMTDGEFNTVYYNGVISGPDSTSGSGSNSNKINHAAGNAPDDTFEQSKKLCDAMKAQDILVYTVGLGSQLGQAANVLNYCATDPTYVYFPADGTEMKQAFREIALRVSKLRLSK
jgi:Flp pilus assembly protein TadG